MLEPGTPPHSRTGFFQGFRIIEDTISNTLYEIINTENGKGRLSKKNQKKNRTIYYYAPAQIEYEDVRPVGTRVISCIHDGVEEIQEITDIAFSTKTKTSYVEYRYETYPGTNYKRHYPSSIDYRVFTEDPDILNIVTRDRKTPDPGIIK